MAVAPLVAQTKFHVGRPNAFKSRLGLGTHKGSTDSDRKVAERNSMWASLPPPAQGLKAIVVLPARNEAAHLPASLAALAAQAGMDGSPLDRAGFEVILLANNCGDASAAIARRFAAAHRGLRLHVVETTLPPAQANIGYVRRLLMDEAATRLESIGCPEAAIVSTDADTRVAPDWLAANLRELAAGSDAVGGRILTDDSVRPSPAALRIRRIDAAHALLRSRLASLLDPRPFDPWPCHHQHFGASLAVTARAYRLAGGVPDVPYLEDDALVRALERVDLRVRRSPHARVTTSSRLDGRAAVGLSWQLRQWAHLTTNHHDPLVENPHRYAMALTVRALLRQLWQRHGAALAPSLPAGIDARLNLCAGTIGRLARAAPAFGALWQELEIQTSSAGASKSQLGPPRGPPLVPISQALGVLRDLIRREQAASVPALCAVPAISEVFDISAAFAQFAASAAAAASIGPGLGPDAGFQGASNTSIR